MSNPLFDSKETSCEPFLNTGQNYLTHIWYVYVYIYIYIYIYHIRQYGNADLESTCPTQSRVQKTCPNEKMQNTPSLNSECDSLSSIFFNTFAIGKSHCRIPSSKPQCLDPTLPNAFHSVDQATTDLVTPKASISSVSNLLGESDMFELVGTRANQTLTWQAISSSMKACNISRPGTVQVVARTNAPFAASLSR